MKYNINMDMDINYAIKLCASLVNESSSILLDRIADDLGRDSVFNITKKISVDDELAIDIFDSLNKNFFDNKLKRIPIHYMTYNEIVNELRKRGVNGNIGDLLGVHSLLLQNEMENIDINTKLIFTDNIILLNKNYLMGKSLIFNIATICHEMIHYYDSLFGEYPNIIKGEYILNKLVDAHDTKTFKYYTNLANDYNLNVIKNMYTDDIDMIDYDTMEKLLSSIYESDDNRNKNKTITNTPHFTIINDKLAVINEFN